MKPEQCGGEKGWGEAKPLHFQADGKDDLAAKECVRNDQRSLRAHRRRGGGL